MARAAAAGTLEIFALWSFLAARHVTAVEAYSLPAALVGLGVGFLAMRRDPELSSWVGYAPGLLAGLLPSLWLAIAGPGEPVRRAGVAGAALVLVIAGSVRRRQAPVVLGGGTLILMALHEATLAWTLMPPWLPIALSGAILLGMAITYERRLRDLRTLRDRIAGYR
jgi:hypothetical protein